MSDEFNPLLRELCIDGRCVGLVGPDGRCKECGKPSLGAGIDPRTRGLRSPEEVAETLAADIIKGDQPKAPEEFADRELCPDGGCIGVLDSNGHCRTCGQQAVQA